jgi:hypothetical protein
MNLDNFFKPPQKGGPSEKETQDFLDSLIKKEELPANATLSDLVKHVREEQKKSRADYTIQNVMQNKAMMSRGLGKAKKYANGGKMRKPTRSY